MRRISFFLRLIVVIFLSPAITLASPVESASTPLALNSTKSATKASTDAIVYLRSSSGSGSGHQGLLAREVARQAVLLAARDQLGISTRDIALREPGQSQAEAAGRLLDLRIILTPEGDATIEIARILSSQREPLLKVNKKLSRSTNVNYRGLVDWCEQLSRKEFSVLLQKEDYRDTKKFTTRPVMKQATVLAAKIEQQLGHMTCLSQFAAIRSLHDKIRREGESLALVGGLVRGYANLGMLTELHWHSAHTVFKARALLYAQRLYVASEQVAWARSHRAYANAACGLHAEALSDLQQATTIVKRSEDARDDQLDLPDWIELIAHFCRFQCDRLAACANHQTYGELASLFELRAIELTTITSRHSPDPELPTAQRNAKQISDRMPHCIRAAQSLGMLAAYDVSDLTYGPKWYQSITQLTACPRAIVEVVDVMATQDNSQALAEDSLDVEAEVRARLIEALHNATENQNDLHEPSCSVLAMMIEDTAFLHGWEIATEEDEDLFLGTMTPWRKSMLSMLARHPLRLYFEYFTTTGPTAYQRKLNRAPLLKKIAATLDTTAVQSVQRPLLLEIRSNEPIKSNQAIRQAFLHNDDGYRGLVFQMRDIISSAPEENAAKPYAEKLYATSPHSPLAIAGMIKYHWPKVAEKASQWQTRYQNNLVVQGALGARFLNEQRYAEARRSLLRYVRRSPDEWAYISLADTYRLQDDEDRWLSTLKEFLSLEKPEWERADVRVRIARYFMDKREFSQALLYADAAAATESSDGMIIAAECNEYLKNFSKAEEYFQSTSEESYRSLQNAWLQFCLRTGHGDVVSARQTAMGLFDNISGSTNREELAAVGYFYLLDHQPTKAILWLQRANRQEVNPYDAIHIALAAQQLDNTKLRDLAIQDAIEKGGAFQHKKNSHTEMIQLARMFQKSLAEKTPGRLDPKTLRRLIQTASHLEKANIHYFAGRFSELLGQQKISRQFYQKSAAATVLCINRTLACLHLRKRGYEPNNVVFE